MIALLFERERERERDQVKFLWTNITSFEEKYFFATADKIFMFAAELNLLYILLDEIK